MKFIKEEKDENIQVQSEKGFKKILPLKDLIEIDEKILEGESDLLNLK